MGTQISAHLANVGITTLLLDLPSQESDRNAIARRAVEQLSSIQPPPLYSPDKLSLIQVGTLKMIYPVSPPAS